MTKQQKWLQKNCDNLNGETVVITGATGDIGKEIVRHVLFLGGKVILAVRNVSKAEEFKNELKKDFKESDIHIHKLNLSSIKSIDEFSNRIKQENLKINHLINNAGVFKKSQSKTEDGYESRFQSNFVGAIYLTNNLLEVLNKNKNSKVVFQTSMSASYSKINWQDLQGEKVKNTMIGYARSKRLLNLGVKTLKEIQNQNFDNVRFVLAHPGVVGTKIFYTEKGFLKMFNPVFNFLLKVIFHSPKTGALPTVYALNKGISENNYIMPKFFQTWGNPKKGTLSPKLLGEKDLNKTKELLKEFLNK